MTGEREHMSEPGKAASRVLMPDSTLRMTATGGSGGSGL